MLYLTLLSLSAWCHMKLQPAQLLVDHIGMFTAQPLPGPVLDVACGQGHNGVFVAQQNLPVICCDKVRKALDSARQLAKENGVIVQILQVDLEQEGINPLREDLYGGILVFRYLHRPLIPCIRKAIKDGGVLIYETFTVDQPQFGKPRNPDFLLQHGELLRWFQDWQVIHFFEGIKEAPTRAVAQIVCRKPPSCRQ